MVRWENGIWKRLVQNKTQHKRVKGNLLFIDGISLQSSDFKKETVVATKTSALINYS